MTTTQEVQRGGGKEIEMLMHLANSGSLNGRVVALL